MGGGSVAEDMEVLRIAPPFAILARYGSSFSEMRSGVMRSTVIPGWRFKDSGVTRIVRVPVVELPTGT